MAQQAKDSTIYDAVELLKDNGFDGVAEAVTVLMNAAMVAERSEYLGARPYERPEDRRGYANGFKGKTVTTRLGDLPLKVPQTRACEFYPQSLEKGLRSGRALLSIAEMFVQGVSSRRVKWIVEKLCGMHVSFPPRCPAPLLNWTSCCLGGMNGGWVAIATRYWTHSTRRFAREVRYSTPR